ncbi:glycosyltransferase [Halomarina salina]|uniref:Glycosyltransferase n=1 Tax=Halomarina salina TaxID=1872699 RepID=A0ABD5RHE3_9EURY|nr:glycosyltransferase [Halomarina salina]
MSTHERKLSFFVPSLTVGGAQRVTVTLANELGRRGYDVDLVLAFRRGRLRSEVTGDVTVVDLRTPTVPVLGLGACVPRLVSYLRSRRPFALFSQMTYANVVALAAVEVAGTDVRAIPTEHNTFGEKEGRKDALVDALAARMYGRADHLVGVSRGVVDSAVRGTTADASRSSVLYNPLPIDEIRDQAAGDVDHPWLADEDLDVVLSVGRLEEQKDLPTLLRAFARVHEERPTTRLLVAGKGSLRDDLERQAAALGIDHVVDFPGYVDNQYACMDRAAVFALSSRHEGLPTTLIEALACGCPVVSTDCPSGPDEILVGGEYGPLVPVGDDEAFAEALLATLDDPVEEERLQSRADEFSTRTVGDDYERFVEGLASQSLDGATEVEYGAP